MSDFALRQWANQHTPSWSADTLMPFDEATHATMATFVRSEQWCADESINVFSVVGTRNSSYFNWSWLHFLNNGKRMDSVNLPLFVSNPGYYDERDIKLPPMSFITVDGHNLFVDADGNHRTCVARFAFAQTGKTQLAGVGVRRLDVDWTLYAAFEEARELVIRKRLRVSVLGGRTPVGREDSGGWKVDRFKPYVSLQDFRNGSARNLDLGGIKAWMASESRSWWGKAFSGLR